MEATQSPQSDAHSQAVIALAMKAGQALSKKLHALRNALEAGQDDEALRIAREIAKPRKRRAA